MVLSEKKTNTFSQKLCGFSRKFWQHFLPFFSVDVQNFGVFSLTRALSPFLTKIDQILLADKYHACSFFFEAPETSQKEFFFCYQMYIIFVSFGSFFRPTNIFCVTIMSVFQLTAFL